MNVLEVTSDFWNKTHS